MTTVKDFNMLQPQQVVRDGDPEHTGKINTGTIRLVSLILTFAVSSG
jgi:hypothetical protein